MSNATRKSHAVVYYTIPTYVWLQPADWLPCLASVVSCGFCFTQTPPFSPGRYAIKCCECLECRQYVRLSGGGVNEKAQAYARTGCSCMSFYTWTGGETLCVLRNRPMHPINFCYHGSCEGRRSTRLPFLAQNSFIGWKYNLWLIFSRLPSCRRASRGPVAVVPPFYYRIGLLTTKHF